MSTSCGCGCREHAEPRAAAARFTPETPVGAVANDPDARAILERFGLNHCCGAHLSLREGAAAAGARLDDVLAALNVPTKATA
jgi:iron-sulfur cluster repair protein YtfE (RIC family)